MNIMLRPSFIISIISVYRFKSIISADKRIPSVIAPFIRNKMVILSHVPHAYNYVYYGIDLWRQTLTNFAWRSM